MNRPEMLQWLLENFNHWEDVDMEDDSHGGWYMSSVGDHNAIEVQHDKLGYVDEHEFKRLRHTVPLKQVCVNITFSKSKLVEGHTSTHKFLTEQEKKAFLLGVKAAIGCEFFHVNKTFVE